MSEDIEKYKLLVDEERFKKELSKLKKLFKEIDPDKKKLVERLIENAAFMQVLLMDLQSDISQNGYKEEYKNGENQYGYKRSIAADLYQVTIKNYSAIIKQLSNLLPEPEEEEKEDPSEEILRFAFNLPPKKQVE